MISDPEDFKEFKALQDLSHFWMQKSYMYYIEKKALEAIIEQNGICVNHSELMHKMNEISIQENERWEKSKQSKKK